jgi:hypothetical protein
MSSKPEDPLDQLVMKTEDVEGSYRIMLAEILAPHIRIDPETGNIYFVPSPPKLNTKQHVLVFLLAKLALSQMNSKLEPIASGKEIEEGTGLPGGTVRPKLAELFRERAISKTPAGYFVGKSNLPNARALLEDTLPPKKS